MFSEYRGAPRIPPARPAEKPRWVHEMKKFEKPDPRKGAVQMLDALPAYLALLVIMYLTMAWHWPYVVTLVLAIPAGALLIRLFIFFHDCGHGSYVASPLGLQVIGNALGVLTLTAFADWRRSHGIHHSTSGNLDRRRVGDVWMDRTATRF